MSAPKYLIDTNVFIGLEDHTEVSPNLASLQQLAGRFGVSLYVHAAAIDDIKRDRNEQRRSISLSKIRKFPTINKVMGLSKTELEAKYGTLRRPNDVVDVTLLHTLERGVVDFLVTEDQGLHERARRISSTLADRVLFVADAVLLLRTNFEPVEVVLPAIREVDAHTIRQDDPIFTSLRKDYPPFDEWWREKCVAKMRKCWVVLDNNQIAGLVVRKDEHQRDTDAKLPGEKILKICTFKVRSENRGVKLGELLLKQALWYARSNKYDVVYLTTFPRQTTLISLLEYYGFKHSHDNERGEMIYEKALPREELLRDNEISLFDLARINYPRFATGQEVKAYVVPIREDFHEILFPELASRSQLTLFEEPGSRTPGNTIRKVYLCRAQADISQPGSILFFYKGKSNLLPSQAITTVGIFEEMTMAHSTEELRQMAGSRSVYTDAQLKAMSATVSRPIKVINFLLAGHLEPPMCLKMLQKNHVFGTHPPQSIMSLTTIQMRSILTQFDLGYSI